MKRIRKPAAPATLKEFFDAYNALVPEANRLGIAWAKVHVSPFESKAAGAKQLARLQGAIAAARKRKIKGRD